MTTATTITADSNGWTTIRCGSLTIIVPSDLACGADERAEIVSGGQRVYVEAVDGDLEVYPSPPERIA